MEVIVLDSFALLSYLRAERSSFIVIRFLETAESGDCRLIMTEVNYSEVKYIILRKHGLAQWQNIASSIEILPLEFMPIDRSLADLTADLKAAHTISLADACAAALALREKGKLVTGDREFRPLEATIPIVWL